MERLAGCNWVELSRHITEPGRLCGKADGVEGILNLSKIRSDLNFEVETLDPSRDRMIGQNHLWNRFGP